MGSLPVHHTVGLFVDNFKSFSKLHQMGAILPLREAKESMRDMLERKYGITEFEKKNSDSSVSTIGFSPKDKKWYGWSHRAIYGFKVGDKIFEPDYGDDKTPFNQHGSKDCKTLEDCKKAARAFADYVG